MARELARADDGAWIVSFATIDTGGPLPAVPGRSRLLTVVEGPVLGLEVGDEMHVVEPQRPFALAVDATASVPEGAVGVLDVVVDPHAVAPFVTVLELGRTSTLPLAADQAAYVVTGEAAGSLVVGPGDVTGRCTVAVITLERA